MAKQRQGDIHLFAATKQNSIHPQSTHPSKSGMMISDSPTINNQYYHNRSTHQSPPSTTIIAEQPASQQTTTDQYHHTETIWRILLDITSLIILATVTVISHYIATPFTRGFFCSDTTIKYPYKGNTIPTYAAVILSIALPIVLMWTTEFCKRFYFGRYPKQAFVTRLELCGKKVKDVGPFWRNLYILTVVFAFGYLCTWVLTEIAKNFVGELRPHFLAVCQPSLNCSTLSTLDRFFAYQQYDTDYTCLNTDYTSVREARRSFFSGHTGPLFFGFGFLIMYIHVSWSWRHLGIVGHLIQIGVAILGCYVGYSRISDFHHHWQDVFFGGIVGSLIAFATFKFILNWRHYTPRFLPYTVSTVQTKSPFINSGSVPVNNNRRISPKSYEKDRFF